MGGWMEEMRERVEQGTMRRMHGRKEQELRGECVGTRNKVARRGCVEEGVVRRARRKRNKGASVARWRAQDG